MNRNTRYRDLSPEDLLAIVEHPTARTDPELLDEFAIRYRNLLVVVDQHLDGLEAQERVA